MNGHETKPLLPGRSTDLPAAEGLSPGGGGVTNLFLSAGSGEDSPLLPEAGGDDPGHDSRVGAVLHLGGGHTLRIVPVIKHKFSLWLKLAGTSDPVSQVMRFSWNCSDKRRNEVRLDSKENSQPE